MSFITSLRVPHLVSHSVNLVLVAAVTYVMVDFDGSIALSKSRCFLNPLLVDVPQDQHRAKSRKLLRHEAADAAARPRDQHHLTRYVLLLPGYEEVDEGLHIEPDGQQEDLDGLQKEIHDEAGMENREE